MYQRNPIIDQLLTMHKAQAEYIVRSTSSKLIKEAFTNSWNQLNNGSMDASISSETIMFNPEQIVETIEKWINDFEVCLEDEEAKFAQIKDPLFSDEMDLINLRTDIDQHVLYEYDILKGKIKIINTRFANGARAYRSPLKQALNDITLLYNDINEIDGNFTGFDNVSVYVHGIEDTGKGFLDSAKEAAEVGDIIVYDSRNSDEEIEYYVVAVDNKGNKYIDNQPIPFDELQKRREYEQKTGRLHVVYGTESKNEHRQKTSDDLAEKLIDMGIMNDETMIDMFKHSYGGRRSLNLAMDYPDYVRSLTTIGTPYDKNLLGSTANKFPGIAKEFFGKNATEYSDYVDFNTKNQRTDDGVLHSNVYTDMESESMSEDLDHLKVANPEVYQKLEAMEMTAAAGRETNTVKYVNEFTGQVETYNYTDSHDAAISVESKHRESLGTLIDRRPSYDVEGKRIKYPANSHESDDEDFIELIRQINSAYKE